MFLAHGYNKRKKTCESNIEIQTNNRTRARSRNVVLRKSDLAKDEAKGSREKTKKEN